MTGSVVTFYSYKGGVGRSFLLSNVGALLSRWGYRVLCIDWDIEAPGLDEYFRPWMGASDSGGLVDFILDYREGKTPDWRRNTVQLSLPQSSRPLTVIPAGRLGSDYMSRVQRIDWRDLYDRRGFGQVLEKVRGEWKEEFDFTLIDSRTGVTDIGGICTVHLPDLLVPVSTANRQSVDGVLSVLTQAIAQRDRLPLNRAGLQVLPVLSRFDTRVQDEVAQNWLRDFTHKVERHYDSWLDGEMTARRLVEMTRIPYFPSWSFGERLAVLEEEENDSESISYHFATIAALLARRLGDTEQLVRHGRDVYVAGARAAVRQSDEATYDFFLSYTADTSPMARDVARILRSHGQSVFIASEVSPGDLWHEKVETGLSNSHNVLFFVPPSGFTKWQRLEADLALSANKADQPKRIVPIWFGDPLFGDPLHAPLALRKWQGIHARGLDPEDVVEELLPGRASAHDGSIDTDLAGLASNYLAIQARDISDRLSAKEEIARLMGHHVLERAISREALVRSDNEAITLALAVAVEMDPQPGDVNRLIEAGGKVSRPHVAHWVLRGIGEAAMRERIIPTQRTAIEQLLKTYERMAAIREDRPLAALADTTRRRLAKLT